MIRPSKLFLCGTILVGGALAQAACPSVLSSSRFTFNAAGNEVTDQQTGLVWARCSVGQIWSGGTCSGSASLHTHEQALQLAKAVSGWRLPNVKELASVVDKGCPRPAIDGSAFPNTLEAIYWSSTPVVGYSNAWVVSFFSGGVAPNLHRSEVLAVRLVRASQ